MAKYMGIVDPVGNGTKMVPSQVQRFVAGWCTFAAGRLSENGIHVARLDFFSKKICVVWRRKQRLFAVPN
jgi:hypothetical protein